jgi:hypothetical protein
MHVFAARLGCVQLPSVELSFSEILNECRKGTNRRAFLRLLVNRICRVRIWGSQPEAARIQAALLVTMMKTADLRDRDNSISPDTTERQSGPKD